MKQKTLLLLLASVTMLKGTKAQPPVTASPGYKYTIKEGSTFEYEFRPVKDGRGYPYVLAVHFTAVTDDSVKFSWNRIINGSPDEGSVTLTKQALLNGEKYLLQFCSGADDKAMRQGDMGCILFLSEKTKNEFMPGKKPGLVVVDTAKSYGGWLYYRNDQTEKFSINNQTVSLPVISGLNNGTIEFSPAFQFFILTCLDVGDFIIKLLTADNIA